MADEPPPQSGTFPLQPDWLLRPLFCIKPDEKEKLEPLVKAILTYLKHLMKSAPELTISRASQVKLLTHLLTTGKITSPELISLLKDLLMFTEPEHESEYLNNLYPSVLPNQAYFADFG